MRLCVCNTLHKVHTLWSEYLLLPCWQSLGYADCIHCIGVRLPSPQNCNKYFLHDNAWPHKNIRTRETITSFRWTTLPHPPYSPYLLPSDYHLFCPIKKGFKKQTLCQWLGSESSGDEVAERRVNKILWGRDTCSHLKVEHCYWEKWWLCWEVGMWSTDDQLHFDVWCMCLCW